MRPQYIPVNHQMKYKGWKNNLTTGLSRFKTFNNVSLLLFESKIISLFGHITTFEKWSFDFCNNYFINYKKIEILAFFKLKIFIVLENAKFFFNLIEEKMLKVRAPSRPIKSPIL